MVTAVCNIFIDSKSKLDLFRDTFPRVYSISDNWLINIRGKHREDVLKYVQENFVDFKKNCIFFSGLDDDNWAKSTRKMLRSSKYEYIYVFLEDHFLLRPLDHFKNVIRDAIDSKIEYFSYSFFNIGLSVQSAEGLYSDYSKHFFFFQFDKEGIEKLMKSNHHFYPYSLASVCTKKYFRALLNIEKKFLIQVPFILHAIMENTFFSYPRNRVFWFTVNKFTEIFGVRFVIYPTETPFNLEKSLFDCNSMLLPLQVGGLKEELFANWDDDNILSNSSLIKRGLYPERFRIDSQVTPKFTEGKEYMLTRGQRSDYQYYPEVSRVKKLPMKYISVWRGALEVSSNKESFMLAEGEHVWVAANIPHSILAREESVFQVYIENGL